MVKIPIEKKLKKKIHRQIALAQDILIVQFYHFFPKAVLHGGTAIWRCFGGNRFSEDLGFYLPSTNSRFDDLIKSLEELGLEKIKFKKPKMLSMVNLSIKKPQLGWKFYLSALNLFKLFPMKC